MKYQFCIRFDQIDANSAASKAVLDCNTIFSKLGYQDFTLTVGDNSNRFTYYPKLLKGLLKFYKALKPGSLVGIQYPLLSINIFFKYFIRLARKKKVRFFCIVHDLESLRAGGTDNIKLRQEIDNLSVYDVIIVHNDRMRNWLLTHGLHKKMIVIGLFDYLCYNCLGLMGKSNNEIVFAGNLGKSTFIYDLGMIGAKFNVYGPNFNPGQDAVSNNVIWKGEYNPEEISRMLIGSYGLIWDGKHIEASHDEMGNYLNYNNPHKASLYLAAGLPLIAPADSAIGVFITATGTGVLINSLYELTGLKVKQKDYKIMKKNVAMIRERVINGDYFTAAVNLAEQYENNG